MKLTQSLALLRLTPVFSNTDSRSFWTAWESSLEDVTARDWSLKCDLVLVVGAVWWTAKLWHSICCTTRMAIQYNYIIVQARAKGCLNSSLFIIYCLTVTKLEPTVFLRILQVKRSRRKVIHNFATLPPENLGWYIADFHSCSICLCRFVLFKLEECILIQLMVCVYVSVFKYNVNSGINLRCRVQLSFSGIKQLIKNSTKLFRKQKFWLFT